MNDILSAKSIDPILDKLDYSKLGKNVAIKIHFGEKGCQTYLNPEIVKKVYNKLLSLGKSATLVECNVLYRGNRSNATDHIKTARSHGFDMPIDILDGEHGRDTVEVNGCKIGAGIKKYDSLIVISHFKGHIAAGFGGSIKNVGMGLGSRAGKLDVHAGISPIITPKCIGCSICIKSCDAKAITLTKDNKAIIDPKRCVGCAMCVAVCPNGAIAIPWNARSSEELQKRISEYAKAVLSLFPNPIFINVLENITKECDCFGIIQKPIMDDVGIIASTNIVAVDKASLDLANKYSDNKFAQVNRIDKESQITQAEKVGLGTSNYRFIQL
jgi:hypothetical protein